MRRVLAITILCLAPSAAFAAELFGTVSENGKPVPQGTALKLDCGETSVSGVTDQFGSYSLKTGRTGDCVLTLTYKGSTASLKVTMYEKPARYDLAVTEQGGKLTIARK